MLHRHVVTAAQDFTRCTGIGAAKGDHKPARDLLRAVGVGEREDVPAITVSFNCDFGPIDLSQARHQTPITVDAEPGDTTT